MAQIVLRNGQKLTNAAQLKNIPPAVSCQVVSVAHLAWRIGELWGEWEEAIEAAGGTMTSVNGVDLQSLFDEVMAIVIGDEKPEPEPAK